ncbi:MAG: FAD-dependent oxidoreductase [Alphaproteobacteria bacterium]|nr:FAD-dependent oxidoreductase [Alphaproteobacteria bacterium]
MNAPPTRTVAGRRPGGGARDTVILGAGLAGLTAGSLVSRSGAGVTVVERDPAVGGLARTVEHNGFRFDLGGHRFHTENSSVDKLVRSILGRNVLAVDRSSKILMAGRYFDYPWRPVNALAGLGVGTAAAVLFSFTVEQIRQRIDRRQAVSFEDEIVRRFGRTMFDIFVRDYSEKVWGVPCRRLARELAEWRIQGLSVRTALRDMLFARNRGTVRTLARKFLYPPLGIGQLADGLRRRIDESGQVLTDTAVTGLHHSDGRIESVALRHDGRMRLKHAGEFASSIPLSALVRLLDPKPPEDILEAAASLRFRDLLVVAVMIDRPRVTDQTWIYVPEREIPFGRIHEPTNWSRHMAPDGKTLLVTEHFCFRGDDRWCTDDDTLVEETVANLDSLGLIRRHEVIDSLVLRVPDAYPLFDIGHDERRRRICDYLARFENLEVIGRGGMFRYFNMDHAMESGIAAAQAIIARNARDRRHERDARAVAEACR